jgi:hypothetical protein
VIVIFHAPTYHVCFSSFPQLTAPDVQIIYDVYKPDTNFSKTIPGPPAFRLCIVRYVLMLVDENRKKENILSINYVHRFSFFMFIVISQVTNGKMNNLIVSMTINHKLYSHNVISFFISLLQTR